MSQAHRQKDDVWCSIAGAAAAGLLGAPSCRQIPARVAGFVVVSYALEKTLLPRLMETNGASQQAGCKSSKLGTFTGGDGGWKLGARAPWGSRTPLADTAVGKAIIYVDLKRQAFEDAVVKALLPELPSSAR